MSGELYGDGPMLGLRTSLTEVQSATTPQERTQSHSVRAGYLCPASISDLPFYTNGTTPNAITRNAATSILFRANLHTPDWDEFGRFVTCNATCLWQSDASDDYTFDLFNSGTNFQSSLIAGHFTDISGFAKLSPNAPPASSYFMRNGVWNFEVEFLAGGYTLSSRVWTVDVNGANGGGIPQSSGYQSGTSWSWATKFQPAVCQVYAHASGIVVNLPSFDLPEWDPSGVPFFDPFSFEVLGTWSSHFP